MSGTRWAPLNKLAHGIAIAPFTPSSNTTSYQPPSSPLSRPITVYSNIYSPTTEAAIANNHRLSSCSDSSNSNSNNDYAYMVPLEVGDELYIFEQNTHWYRGYVLSSLEEGGKPNNAPNGIFPKTHVQIKEYLDMDPYDSSNSDFDFYLNQQLTTTLSSTATPPPLQSPSILSTDGLLNSQSDTVSLHKQQQQSHHDDHISIPATPSILSRPGSGDFEYHLSLLSSTDIHHQLRGKFENDTILHQQQSPQKRPLPPPLPMARFDQSTVTGNDEPLVDEIGACVSEWNCLLYTYLKESRYSAFNAIRDHINYLFQARRQLLDQALSKEELARLRKVIIQRMVTMNISQNREMIVRHPERGYILDIDNTSAATLFYMHWKYTISEQVPITSLPFNDFLLDKIQSNHKKIALEYNDTLPHHHQQHQHSGSSHHHTSSANNNNNKKKQSFQNKGGKFHHLFLDLKACVAHICQPGEWTELCFSLYSESQGKFITEQFVVNLNYNGMPRDESKIGKLQTLFVDLSTHDLNDQLYLVCYIYRLGSMKFMDKEKDHLSSFGSHASAFFGNSSHNQHSGGSGYFDNNSRYHYSQHQKSSPSDLNTQSSHNNISLFRRPFACAVLNVGKLLQPIEDIPIPHSMHGKTTRSGSIFSDSDLIRSPTYGPQTPTLSPSITSVNTSGSSSSSSGSGNSNTTHYQIVTSEQNMRIYIPASESSFANLHEDIIREKGKEISQNARAEMVHVYLRMFYGQQDDVLKVNAALLQDIPRTLRIGFPDVVFPDDERNELYINLVSGDFAQFGRTRNIQVIVCVRDNQTGEIVEDSVAVGSGTPMMSTWESAIFYHEMKPVWKEMVKVKISDIKVWEKSHIFLVVKHRSSQNNMGSHSMNSNNNNSPGSGNSRPTSPFTRLTSEGNSSSSDKILAMGYIPLFIPPLSRDFVADGTHKLCLYKYDRQLLHPSSYFGTVPWCGETNAPSNMQSQDLMLSSFNQTYRQIGQHFSRNTSQPSIRSNGSTATTTAATTKNNFFQSGNMNLSTVTSLVHQGESGSSSIPISTSSAKPHSTRDFVVVNTFLCSTRFTQNTTLVQLMKWRSLMESSGSTEDAIDELLVVLDKFTFVGEMEVVKFLADIFDALLDILSFKVPQSTEKQDLLHDQAIASIIWILSIVQDRRFSNFRPVLDVYIYQRFNSNDDSDGDSNHHHDNDKETNDTNNQGNNNNGSMYARDTNSSYQLYTSSRYQGNRGNNAKLRTVKPDDTTYNQLLKGMIRLCSNPSEPRKAKQLRSSIKVWEYLFRFIVRSREYQRNNEEVGESELRELMYKEDLQQFLSLIIHIMAPEQPSVMIGTQTLVLQHFNEMMIELKDVFSAKEIVNMIQEFIDGCSHVTGKMVGYKLCMILALVKGPVFNSNTCSFGLGKHIVRWTSVWLNTYMSVAKDVIFSRTMDNNKKDQVDDHQQTRLPRSQWIENLRLSMTIIHEILNKIRKARGLSTSVLTSTATGASSPLGMTPSTTMTGMSTSTSPSLNVISEHDDEDPYINVEDQDNDSTTNLFDTGLGSLTDPLICLLPQLLRTYKDLQRLANQSIQATTAPSSSQNNPLPGSSNSASARTSSRHSLTVLRDRANSISIRGLPQVSENTTSDINTTASGSSVPVVLQALATSPAIPFPTTYPFQTTNALNQITSTVGSDLVALVTSGVLDLTVILLDLFHLTSAGQWLQYLHKMVNNEGVSSTSDFLCNLCFVCLAILYGDDIQKLADVYGTMEGNDIAFNDPINERRKWPSNWLNLDVVAHKIILVDVLSPTTSLLDLNAFSFIKIDGQQQQQQPSSNDKKDEVINDISNETDMLTRLWRIMFNTFVRILASKSLEVETFLPQAQRAVWKLAGNIRGEEGTRALKHLWDLAFPSCHSLLLQPSKSGRISKHQTDSQKKPELLAYFDHHGKKGNHYSNSNLDVSSQQSDVGDDDSSSINTNEFHDVISTTVTTANHFSTNKSSTTSLEDQKQQQQLHDIKPNEATKDDNSTTDELSSLDAISPSQLDYLSVLLKPLCGASLTIHDKLRSTTVGMIADIITILLRKNNSISEIQNSLIATIDKLVMTHDNIDDEIRTKWVGELYQALQLRLTDSKEREYGHMIVDSLANLIELLLQIRSLPQDDIEFTDERINATLKLMKFVQVFERQDIYVKYVHELVNLHLISNNYVEAALTLRFHADLLEWDPYGQVEAIPELGFATETPFARKQSIYETMINYLDKGTAWELCLDLSRELAHQYGVTIVDYHKCSKILQRMAIFTENIVKKERFYCEYFRVGFYGRGFPASIRNQQFIYRGMAWEKMASFSERIQNRHPNAQILSSKLCSMSTLPDDQLRELETESDGQFIQITAVTPELDMNANSILSNPMTGDKIKKYYEFNQVHQFTYSRPVTKEEGDEDEEENEHENQEGNDHHDGNQESHSEGKEKSDQANDDDDDDAVIEPPNFTKQELDFLHLWTEQTTFTSQDVFPTIALRSKIKFIQIKEISPIENAVNAMNNKTNELISLDKVYADHIGQSQSNFNLNPFSMALNGAVDAPVNGGVPLYKKAFLSSYYRKKHPKLIPWIDLLKKAIDEQVLVIDRCLVTHSQLVSNEMKPFHNNLIELFKKNFSDDIQRLKNKETPFKSLGSVVTSNNINNPNPANTNRSNMGSNHSNTSLASMTANRRGSSLFRDLERPILMKSRTNSITHGTNITTGGGNSPHLVSPKSPSYFTIPTVYEEDSSSRLKLQHTESSSSLESTSSLPSGHIHPNEISHTTKSESNNGLSKSLKLTIRRKTTRKSSNASSG
ncbi:hypothetical protein BJ944DRAFT_240997 [Cunninghamella echinulata]|nr:hypothetical protein BJ944DRAFT_240997 [Cunninghamella echinulata]